MTYSFGVRCASTADAFVVDDHQPPRSPRTGEPIR
jgi:hypothetical protein